MNLKISVYKHTDKPLWDSFVRGAKNGHFLFERSYMDYHSDRFKDLSFMVFNEKDKLIAVLAANVADKTLYSHQGLTFGGFLVDDGMRTQTMLSIFQAFKGSAKEQGLERMVYKCIPAIYHTKPSEEDRYALFANDAKLIKREITSAINLCEPIRYTKGRKWSINKAAKHNIIISEHTDYASFWKLLTATLHTEHSIKPTHSLAEIQKLAGLFSQNIRLFLATKNQEVLSGAVIYESNEVAHTQYLASSKTGRKLGSLDYLIDYLVKIIYKRKKYFDFGISNEQNGQYLNEGLAAYKEGFGAGAVAQDTYELCL